MLMCHGPWLRTWARLRGVAFPRACAAGACLQNSSLRQVRMDSRTLACHRAFLRTVAEIEFAASSCGFEHVDMDSCTFACNLASSRVFACDCLGTCLRMLAWNRICAGRRGLEHVGVVHCVVARVQACGHAAPRDHADLRALAGIFAGRCAPLRGCKE